MNNLFHQNLGDNELIIQDSRGKSRFSVCRLLVLTLTRVLWKILHILLQNFFDSLKPNLHHSARKIFIKYFIATRKNFLHDKHYNNPLAVVEEDGEKWIDICFHSSRRAHADFIQRTERIKQKRLLRKVFHSSCCVLRFWAESRSELNRIPSQKFSTLVFTHMHILPAFRSLAKSSKPVMFIM